LALYAALASCAMILAYSGRTEADVVGGGGSEGFAAKPRSAPLGRQASSRRAFLVALTVVAWAAVAWAVVGADARPSRLASPGLIAFESVKEDQQGTETIWTVRSDGSQRRKLAFGGDPAWSPDGRTIAYTLDGVYLLGVDGQGKRRLTRDANFLWNSSTPRWSPDGKRIVYVYCRGPDCVLKVVTIGSGRSRTLVASQLVSTSADPDWSPDGRWIVWAGEPGVYAIRPSGGRVRTISAVFGFGLRWSPGGRKLLFIGGGGSLGDLFVMNADGTAIRLLAKGGYAAAWSPDSREIAYAEEDETIGIGTLGNGRWRRIPVPVGGTIVSLDWQPVR
jgi:Tol biopolymer transport system component